MDSELYKEIVNIMTKVQVTTSCHQKYRSVLIQLYKRSDIETFVDCIQRILSIILSENPKIRNIYVERVIDFWALFCTAPELKINPECEEHALLEEVFYFLLTLHNLEDDIVRYRVCELINKFLNNLTDTELNEDLCDKIEKAMLRRLKDDSKSEIRFQAVSAVYRLQNPDNKECKVIKRMILHMSGDLSAKVRKICVQKIGIRRDVLAGLVKRVRDVNNEVRLAAFTRASKLGPHFKISEKHIIIRSGFLDSFEPIKTFTATQLVPAWLEDYNNDYLKLLKAVRLDANESYIEKTTDIIKFILKRSLFCCRPVEELLEVLPKTSNRTLVYENLNWETVIYWRYLCEFLRKREKFEIYLYNILPDLVDFVKYIQIYYKQKLIDESNNTIEFQFIIKQLFIITKGYDVSDTVSRQALNKLVGDILKEINLTSNTTKIVIENLENTIPKIEERCNFICEVISDIMYPISEDIEETSINTAFQISEIKVQLNCLNEELISAIKTQNFESASKYKNEINKLTESLQELQTSVNVPKEVVKKTDSTTMLKCLNIARGLLVSPHVTVLTPALRTLCEDVIIEQLMLENQDDDVRTRAFECYALYCIIDEKHAYKGIRISSAFLLRSTNEDENCNIEALIIFIKTTVDLLILYGPQLLKPENDEESSLISLTDVVQSLVDLMDHESIEVQLTATQGLCNLIVKGRIQSSSLISRMILKWCNPTSGEEDSQGLRQIIGMMLEQLPKLEGSANVVENAFLPIIKTLVAAPNTSPLFAVNIYDIVKFLLALCNMCVEDINIQSHLAVTICCEIRDNKPVDTYSIILSKILLMLSLDPDDKQTIKDLLPLCDEIEEEIRQRTVLSNIMKFHASLEMLSNTEEATIIVENAEE